MSSLAVIPPDDLPDFARYPEECRREVQQLLRVMQRLLQCAGRGIGSAICTEAARMNTSAKTLRTKYDAFRKTGDWRVLVNKRDFPAKPESTLPPAFVEYWKTLAEQNQRKSKPAYRLLLRQWRAWQRGDQRAAIPGYETCPPETAHGHPERWSYRTLLRKLPTKFELAAMREGLGSAVAKHGPQILTTRVGLYVGSHFVPDDVLRDFKVALLGRQAIARIQELGVMDLYSGDRFAVHRRPLWSVDGKKDSVKEAEMRFLIAAVMRNTGYSPRGTTILAELGTAAVRPPLAEFLFRHSGEKVRVQDPGATGKLKPWPAIGAGGGGNPKHKRHLESHHNLLQNEAANLPAATGHDKRPPEWLHGVEAITQDVLKSLAQLPPERAELMIAPMVEYWQGVGLLNHIDQLIAWRTDHDLEGWVKCGHVVTEYRHDLALDQWMTTRELLALPPAHQQLLVAAATADARYRRTRKLAPREVLSAGMDELIRFPDHVIALMFCDAALGADLSVPKRLRADGRFHLQHEHADAEEMEFLGIIRTPREEEIALDERAIYGVVLNPFDPQQLWVYAERGGYLGTAARVQRACLHDAAALQAALGQRSHQLASLLTPLRKRHAGAAAEIRSIQEHNARVRSGVPITLQDRANAEQRRERTISADEFLTDPSGTDEPQKHETPADFCTAGEGFANHKPSPADAADFL